MKQSFIKKSGELITVLTKDKKELKLKKSAAMNSALLRKQMEESKDEDEPLVLQEVEDKIIDKLWEYLERIDEHEIKEIEKPLVTNILII